MARFINIVALATMLAMLAAFGGIVFYADISANGGDEGKGDAHPGKQVFGTNYRVEVEPIEARVVEGFPGQIKPGETAEMRLAITNHSPSTDWVVTVEAEFDLSNVVLHSPGLGVEAGMFHGDTGAVYHPGDPLVVPAGGSKDLTIVVMAHDGAGWVLIKNVSVYRIKPHTANPSSTRYIDPAAFTVSNGVER